MTLASVLYALFGAALVAIGVLAAALADRVRGLRVARERAAQPRELAPRAAAPIRAIEVVEAERVLKSERAPRAPRSESKMQSMGEDVIAALVAAGYKRPIATEAAWGCGATERATIESWTGAALRRCARGDLS